MQEQFRSLEANQNQLEQRFNFFIFIQEQEQIFLLMFYETNEKLKDVHRMIMELHNDIFTSTEMSFADILNFARNIKIEEKHLDFPIDLNNPDMILTKKLMTYARLTP